VIAVDPFGGVTSVNPAACTSVTTTSGNQSVQLVMPASFPGGAAGVLIFDRTTGSYVNFASCFSPQVSVPGSTITLTSTFEGCTYANPIQTSAVANFVSTSNGIGGSKLLLNGEFLNAAPRSEQNIFLPGALSTTWTGSTWTLDRGSERDARAGTGEDGAGGMHDERGGAVNRWDDAGKRDNCGRGERFRCDYAELCGRSGAHAERADGRGRVHDDAGGCQCDDTVPDAVKLRFSEKSPTDN